MMEATPFAIVFLASILIHEAGHWLAYYFLTGRKANFEVKWFGYCVETNDTNIKQALITGFSGILIGGLFLLPFIFEDSLFLMLYLLACVGDFLFIGIWLYGWHKFGIESKSDITLSIGVERSWRFLQMRISKE